MIFSTFNAPVPALLAFVNKSGSLSFVVRWLRLPMALGLSLLRDVCSYAIIDFFFFFLRAVLTRIAAMATVQSDIFKPTKYGGKYTVTLIPGIVGLISHS